MKTNKTGLLGGLALGAAVTAALGVGIGHRMADPTSVAVVDIDGVSAGLEEFKEREAEVNAKRDARFAELQAINDQIGEIGLEMESLTQEQQERGIQLAIEGQVLQSDLQTKTQLYQQENDLLKANLTRELYAKIVEAAEQIAERDGYDIVLFDDRSITLDDPSAASFAGSVAAIKSKKVLYASDVVDLTPSVTALMNNEFASGE